MIEMFPICRNQSWSKIYYLDRMAFALSVNHYAQDEVLGPELVLLHYAGSRRRTIVLRCRSRVSKESRVVGDLGLIVTSDVFTSTKRFGIDHPGVCLVYRKELRSDKIYSRSI